MENDSKWGNLQALKQLHDQGFITGTEYRARLKQLIDGLTGTTISTPSGTVLSRSASVDESVVPRPPPDFTDIEAERAVRWTYDLKKEKWSRQRIRVKLDPMPFARGALRVVYHMKICEKKPAAPFDAKGGPHPPQRTHVAKIALSAQDNENRSIYFRDVEMQCLARYIASKFNRCNPPKRVDFLEAFVVELVEREGTPVCGVETFISGSYRKHNGNFGYVSEDERSTPQAFSHFSWHASGGTALVCDIQGVSDLYTDPQVHSVSGKGYGRGNLGMKGVKKFLEKHRCNRICQYLKLPPCRADGYAEIGTMPVTRIMHDSINVLTYDPRFLEQKPLTAALPIHGETARTGAVAAAHGNAGTHGNAVTPACKLCVIV